MRERARKGIRGLLGPASIYVAANIINAAVPFVLMPVLTRHLSTAEYGVVAMFQVLTGFVGPFVGFNVHGAIHRRYYDDDTADLPSYIGSCYAILACSALTSSVALWALGPWVSELTSFPRSWLWAVVAMSVSQFLIQIRLVIWQAGLRPVLYGAFQITQTLANLGLSVWLVVGLEWGWEGRVVGQTAAYVTFGIVAVVWLVTTGWVRLRVRKDYVVNALRFGVPLIPHTFATYAITATDKVFITNLIGVGETGVYLIAVQISAILGLLAVSINNAATPWIYARLREGPQHHGRIIGIVYGSLPLAIVAALAMSAVAPYLLSFYVGADFVRAGDFVFWLLLGQAFNAVYVVVVNLIFYVEKTHFLLWTTMSAAALNVALNYPLTLSYGATGAAIATAITFFVKMALTFWLATRVTPLPWGEPVRLLRQRI